MEVSLPLMGGCYCRRVRYEIRLQPLTLVACHCTICQTRTGSAFSMSMPVMREGFVVTEGATITRDLPGGSGNLLTQHFCDYCLVRTHTEPHANRAVVYVRPGTLDDRSWLKPVAQLWTNDGRPWACIDGILTFEGEASEPVALLRAFREAK
jgi:hypothetical protein